MPDVLLVTGREMPHGPEAETPLLMAALRQRGVSSAIEPWGSDAAGQGRLVVIRTTWDYTANIDAFLAWVRDTASITTMLNPAEVIEWNSHKSYLLDLAYAAVPVIPTALVLRDASEAQRRTALEEYEGEVVIKPAVSVGAYGTVRAVALSAQAAAHLESLTRTGDALVQPYEPTIVDGEVSLMYFGGEYSHAVRKIPAAGDYRVQIFYGGVIEPHAPSADELAVAAAALAAVAGDLAYARVDLVETSRGPVLMELELIEPQLFLEEAGDPAVRFADHLVSRLQEAP